MLINSKISTLIFFHFHTPHLPQVLKYSFQHCLGLSLVTQEFTLRLNISQQGNVIPILYT